MMYRLSGGAECGRLIEVDGCVPIVVPISFGTSTHAQIFAENAPLICNEFSWHDWYEPDGFGIATFLYRERTEFVRDPFTGEVRTIEVKRLKDGEK